MKIKTMLALVLGALTAGVAMAGDLAVSAYWQDHMVLQRGKNITVWGKDAPGRTVTVSFTNQTATATTGSDGFWETTFAQPFAVSATPQVLTITDNANESITLSDVLVGDVFLASGQSNMDRRLKYGDFDEPQSVKDFCEDDDGIRFIRIAKSYENSPAGEELFDLPPLKELDEGAGYRGEGFDWAPATMGGVASNKYHVSSVALNFAHYIRRANAENGLNIPIGIIHASYGGAYIRWWIKTAAIAEGGYKTVPTDSRCWNIMLAPILRAKFCAVLWYQGCSDSDIGYVDDTNTERWVDQYKAMMDILVKDWRAHWGENGDLPFYAVQIGAPNYNSASGTIGLDKYPAPTEDNVGHNYAPIREHQRRWNMSDAGKHGLVTIVDCVDCLSNGSLHPTDKNFVGRRLSLLARRDIYGETDLPAEGPTYTRAVRESDGSVRIFFKPGTAKGLTAGRMKPATDIAVSRWIKKDTDPIRGFAVCGSDNVWKDAVATVDGETIVLRADGVATPTKFHYGYWCVTRETLQEDGQRLNLYNDAELPMSPVAPQAVEDAAASTKVVEPVIVPGSCLFSPSTNVTITCATSGATIHYTLDGSEPTSSSSVYSAPIAISATTTIKARAFAANKEASDVVFATYTLGDPPAVTADPQWIVSSYDASSWSPLSGNILAGKTGTISGSVAFASSGYNNDPGNLTDASVPSTPDNSAYVGFQENASIYWTFDEPQTIETIRFTTQRIAGADGDVSRAYGGLHIEDVYVRTSGSSEWEPLGTPIYQKGGTVGGFMLATLADDGIGLLAENVVALKVVFLRSEYVWFNVAEVEATGYATAGGTVGPVEPITPVAGSLVVDTTISDHCVLQRGTNNCVKGTATVGSTVTVTFGGVSASAVAGSDGSFSVSINPGAANATGRDLVVSDTVNTVTITDVVVGDVWYISGQSNVRYTVDALAKSKALADCDYPSLRMMMLPSANPGLISASDAELPCAWSVCSATTCTNMSATGFFFGRELVKAENVPVGVVVAAINGSYIANWLPNANCDNYMASRANHIALKGAVWYQGESDALNYSDRSYPNRLKSLVRHLRTRPGNEGLPVVVVQLPRYRDTYKNCGNQAAINCWGIFRVDQDLAAADMDGVVCVPTIEYGAEYNIHPSDKDLMGARIALAARNLAYGENVAYRCPYPTSVEKNEAGTTVTVTFPETTTLVATNDTASVLFGEDREMFSVGGANVMPAISADGHSLVFTGSFADATSVEYGICGYPKILFVDANGFPMPPFSLELTGGGSGGEPVETAATPTFSPAACSFYPATNVTLSCATSGATIRYTLDGSDPTSESAEYTAPIALSATTTIKARAYKAEMNPSAVASATYTLVDPGTPLDPGGDPSGESVRTWTSGDYDPSTWTSLENNILAGLTAVATDMSKITGYASSDLSTLTDGKVLASSVSADTVGLMPDSELVWTFDGPKVLEKIRFSSRWNENIRAGITVKDILVKTSGSTEWVSLGVSFSRSGLSTAAGAQYALLSDPGLGYLALDVVALKFVSGPVEGFANYYAEIEAVGRTGGDAYPPALSGIKINPWGTSAEFSGSVVSLGTGASSCDVYLAYGPDADHLGEPVNIYTGGVGAFHYEIEGLATNTTYSYQIAVSNNAATVMGCEASGSFATTSEVHPDWSGYKWAVIGDSLSDPTLAPGAENYYYSFVVRDTGIQLVYTNGVGSTGYKNKYNVDGGKAFYQRLLASPLPSDVDVVTIFGSVNDWGLVSSDADAGEPTDSIDDGKTTLAAYMNKAIDVVQAQAPNARLVLVGSLYYYNAGTVAHVRANETLRAVAAQRGVAFYDWLTEDPNDPLDFHHIADNPTAEGSFAQRYTRDCPTEIDGGNTLFGHPSAEYHEVWLSPHFRGVLTAALAGVPVQVTVATPVLNPASCSFYPSTNITLSCATAGATIRYTLNGSDPTAESTVYEAPLAISATTTVKARAFADGMNPSAIASATYTLVDPGTPPDPGDDPTVTTNGMWATSEFALSAWSPLANNLLANMTGTTSGYISGYGGGAGLLTDGAISGDTKQTCGFGENATVAWTFDGSKTLEKIRFTTCYTANWGIYDDIKISKVEVKTSGSDSWTDLGVVPLDYAGTGTANVALSATLENTTDGFLAQSVTALRITFAAPNNVAQYYAEIEAVGSASGAEPVETVASPIFSPASCSFYPSTNVMISCATSSATIRYTLDGSTPTESSEIYTVPLELFATTTIKARAFAADMNPSATVSATYTLEDPSAPAMTWATNEFALSAWSRLENNLLANMTGTTSGYISGYGGGAGLLTDGAISGETAQTCGFGENATVAWTFDGAKTLEKIRFTTCFTAGWGWYDDIKISKIEVKTSGSDDWADLGVEPLNYTGSGTADTALSATLEDATTGFLAQNVTALRITFAAPYNVAQYYAEIEAVGTSASGKVYPEWIDSTDLTVTAKYDTWATKFNVADPTTAQKDAYLLNCANTAEALAAAKAAFKTMSITVNADGTVDVGLPTAPEGGFNVAVTILGCETVDGTYHALTTGTVIGTFYRVPAASNYRFFKASLDIQ